jgi:hypothetical protein
MEKLIQLITKLYGKNALSKTLGTRTNVITLSDNETKRFIKEELNIEAASDAAAQAAKDRAEKLIADIPKMNDQEILTFTGNLQRLDNKLNPPSAEVVQMGSKEVVPAEGIEQLAAGQTAKRLMDETISMAEKRQRSANEGLIRTAVRFKMIKDLREGKLKVPEEIAQSISQVGSSRNDPIKLFEKYYGPDALEIVDELSPEFRMIERRGGTEMDLVTKIEQNVDARPLTPQEISDMAANTREAGRVRQEVEEGNIIPLTGKDPEEFATGGRVGLKNGSEDVITITDKIDELISFYKNYLKQGGKMNFMTFAKKYIPENFATGGRVGFDDGGLGSLPTGLQMDTTTSNPIPENAPNMAADEIAKVIMGTGFLPEEDDEIGYPEGMEKPMSSKLFIFEQYVIPQRKKMMENFDLTLKEADDLIRQEMEKYRTNKATGGRVGYAYGSGLKLIQLLQKAGKSLKDEIKKAVDDLIPSGDPKLDADMAVDNMLEDLNIDRDAIDQYDILDAYGLAYDKLKQPLLKEIKETKSLAPKMIERFELKERFPGIDEDLLTKIVEDPDPQRKAEVIATIEQAFELMKQGKSSDEVLDIMKQMTDRTKQAGGGLSYLSGF